VPGMHGGAVATTAAAAGAALPCRLWGRCWLLTAKLGALCRSEEEGLAAFMGCEDPWFGQGYAWTFKCPPGHRIVGYAGSASSWVNCVCFLTAQFRDPAEC
jgi:hypothetical protein